MTVHDILRQSRPGTGGSLLHGLLSITALLLAGGSPANCQIHHEGLPLYPVSYSEAEKEQQRSAGVSIVRAINEAAKAGEQEFTAPAGVYRLPEGSGKIELNRISDGFRLNLQNVEFVKEDHTPLFLLNDSRGIEIVGPVVIDCDPLPYIQGCVYDYSHESGRVTMQVTVGFPLEVEESVVKVFSPEGIWLKNPQWNTCRDYEIIDPEKRLVAFTPKLTKDGPEEIFVEGNQLVIGHGNNMFACRRVEDLTMSDVFCYHGGGIMWGDSCGGDWQMRRVRSVPRPGTCRLPGGNAFQVAFENGALTMEECAFSSNTDDLLDIQMGRLMVCKQESPNTIILRNDVPQPGDKLTFYTHDEFAVSAEATVARLEDLKAEEVKSFETELEKQVQQRKAFIKYRADRPIARVILDQPLDLQNAFWVENRSRRFDVTMRNCHWRDCSTRVLIQGCSSALIEGNTFDKISGGLVVNCDVWWLEGGTGHNVTIRNNRFTETSHRRGWASGDAAIIIGPTLDSWPRDPGTTAFEKISIIGNHITNSSAGAVRISNASRIQIRDNTIDGLFLEKPAVGAFRLTGCADIKIGTNQFSRPPVQTVQTINCRNVETAQ